MKVKFRIPMIFFIILVISVTFMIFSSSFFNTLYDESFYSRSFEKYGVYDKTLEPEMKIMEVLAFFTDEIDSITQDGPAFIDKQFTDSEISHLEDVKGIFSVLKNIYFVSFFLFIVLIAGFSSTIVMKHKGTSKFHTKFYLFFIKVQGYVLLLSSSIMVIIWALAFFSFDNSFKFLHNTLFQSGTWTFPADSLSAYLFPKGLFYDFALSFLRNVGAFVLMLAVLFIFVYLLYAMKEKKPIPFIGTRTSKKRS